MDSFEVFAAGNGKLLNWLASFGEVAKVGVEGTGSYGAGLAGFLRGAGVGVVEVDRPNRPARRRTDKSGPADAVGGRSSCAVGPRPGCGQDQRRQRRPIRALVVAKRSAKSTHIKSMNQIRHLGFTAPDELRERLRGVSRDDLGPVAASLQPRAGGDPVMTATKTAIGILVRRVLALDAELAAIDRQLKPLVVATAPRLLEVHGVGINTAAILLIAPGDNPDRLRSEAAWAHLCGTALIPSSSGKVIRWRLNRGGDRQATAPSGSSS